MRMRIILLSLSFVVDQVYGNEFTNTGTGVIVARQLPQGIVCGNSCTDGVCDVIG